MRGGESTQQPINPKSSIALNALPLQIPLYTMNHENSKIMSESQLHKPGDDEDYYYDDDDADEAYH